MSTAKRIFNSCMFFIILAFSSTVIVFMGCEKEENIPTPNGNEIVSDFEPGVEDVVPGSTDRLFIQQLMEDEWNNFDLDAQQEEIVQIKFHVISKDDGSEEFDESILPQFIITANNIFRGARITFEQCGDVNVIMSDQYYDFNVCDLESFAISPRFFEGVINVYLFNTISKPALLNNCPTMDTKYIAGRATFPGQLSDAVLLARGKPNESGAWQDHSTFLDNTFVHELGHYFSLFHTHETATGIENVQRTNCGVDADGNWLGEAGDLLCDTPADPGLPVVRDQNGNPVVGDDGYNYTVDGACKWIGDEYYNVDYRPDTLNIMSYCYALM